MISTTLADFRKETKKYMDKVTIENETIIINRGKDSGVVIMSLKEYNSIEATLHELSSTENAIRLFNAIKNFKSGKGKRTELKLE